MLTERVVNSVPFRERCEAHVLVTMDRARRECRRTRHGAKSLNVDAIGICKGSCCSEEAVTSLPPRWLQKADDEGVPCIRIYSGSH